MAGEQATALLPLPGDANLDGVVDGTDFNAVLSNYGRTGTDWSHGDFNGDGVVNGEDLNLMLSNYNRSVGLSAAAAVPEPGNITLLLAAAPPCSLLLGNGICRGQKRAESRGGAEG